MRAHSRVKGATHDRRDRAHRASSRTNAESDRTLLLNRSTARSSESPNSGDRSTRRWQSRELAGSRCAATRTGINSRFGRATSPLSRPTSTPHSLSFIPLRVSACREQSRAAASVERRVQPAGAVPRNRGISAQPRPRPKPGTVVDVDENVKLAAMQAVGYGKVVGPGERQVTQNSLNAVVDL